ncbi:putative F-box/LRR-repeat protein At3g18150 [Capsella rubella]|uniref:putative F-box/LRR-repeat protein At3g18150 n=1 Tax=Capsella rubella TaxID=81985 RepID=UPI000CD57646|nr:putative F-box/LRR-repeat protein At3g18150 [Capsella rubella]
MSRNVENVFLQVPVLGFEILDCFFSKIELASSNKIRRNVVSWTSLKKFSLRKCTIPDASIAKILSGCRNLECLTLHKCQQLRFLDLRKMLHLRTLEIYSHYKVKMRIVAPHIHSLRFVTSQLPCTLVKISSLTEARLDICINSTCRICKADFLQDMMLELLEKLKHVEKLTFGGNFLQILSLAEVREVPFPMLKVKTLILETVIFQYVVPALSLAKVRGNSFSEVRGQNFES